MTSAVRVSGHLGTLHPLVRQTKQHLAERWNTQGRLSAGKDGLDVLVSRAQVGRACHVLDAVIRTLEHQGAQIAFTPTEGTYAKLDGETVHFGLMEAVKQVKATSHAYHMYEFIPRGELILHIRDTYLGCRTKWSDGKRGKLEDKLESFIAGLWTVATCLKQQRQEREENQRQSQEAERQRERQRQAREAEEKRRKSLEAEALAWQHGRLLRSYIRARIRQQGAYTPESEFGQWVTWAMAHADRLDPVTKTTTITA